MYNRKFRALLFETKKKLRKKNLQKYFCELFFLFQAAVARLKIQQKKNQMNEAICFICFSRLLLSN